MKIIHGNDGGLRKHSSTSFGSLWIEAVKSTENLKVKGIDLLSLCEKRVGDGYGSVF